MIDCRVKHIIEQCNCLPFFYPYFRKIFRIRNINAKCTLFSIKNMHFTLSGLPKYSNVRLCTFDKMSCLRKIRTRISSTAPPQDAAGFDQFANKSDIGLQCDCLEGCQEIVSEMSVIPNNRIRINYSLHFRNTILIWYNRIDEDHQITHSVNWDS